MSRIPLSGGEHSVDESLLDSCVQAVQMGRYFNKIEPELLRKMLVHGELLNLKKDDFLIREGDDSPPEMYILIEGSLAVESQSKFILRLELPGDVIGELSAINQAPRSADVLAVDKNATHASIFYVVFAHLLAEKLRITTAQSLTRKNERVISSDEIKVAIIDESQVDRLLLRGVVEFNWAEAQIVEYDSFEKFIQKSTEHHFELIIADIQFAHSYKNDKDAFTEAFKAMKIHGSPTYIISDYCNDSIQREFLMKLGADELEVKPYSLFDVKHTIAKFKVWFYKHQELDQIERDADTDRLTGLANRRRLDEFLEALFTLYPENKQGFSMVISDVDNFKHYNDTHGHQMGDVVLSRVASIFAKNVRRGDLAARFGGEEFVMVLPNCGMKKAISIAEKLRKSLEDEVFPYQDQQPTGNLTATFGVASYPGPATLDEMLKWADDCLYRGKEAGRNVVIAADQ